MSDQQTPAPEQKADDAPLSMADTGGKWGILPEIGIKLLNNFLSRKFIVLVIAVSLFLRDAATFSAQFLVWVFALYCITSAADKLIDKIPGGKQ